MILPDQFIPITLWEWIDAPATQLSKETSKGVNWSLKTIPGNILTIDLTLYQNLLTMSADAIAQKITSPVLPLTELPDLEKLIREKYIVSTERLS